MRVQEYPLVSVLRGSGRNRTAAYRRRDLYGHERYKSVTALRSLFSWAKKTGVIFRNPATGSRSGSAPCRSGGHWTPGTPQGAIAAAATPQALVCIVLAALHTARPAAIRALQLGMPNSPAGGCASPGKTGRWAS